MLEQKIPCPVIADPPAVSQPRPPEWRWQSATKLFKGDMRISKDEDPRIADAVRFLRDFTRKGEGYAAAQWPDVHSAHYHYHDAPIVRGQIEAKILSGASLNSIADRFSLTVDTVANFKALFFDVTDSIVWLRHEVFTPSTQHAPEPKVLKVLAIIGGEGILDLVLWAFRFPFKGPPEHQDMAKLACFVARLFSNGRSAHPLINGLIGDWRKLLFAATPATNGITIDQLNTLRFRFRDVLDEIATASINSQSAST